MKLITVSLRDEVGTRCADGGHDDVVDVHVAPCARERSHAVVTSDPDDTPRTDAALPLLRA